MVNVKKKQIRIRDFHLKNEKDVYFVKQVKHDTTVVGVMAQCEAELSQPMTEGQIKASSSLLWIYVSLFITWYTS